MKGFKGSKAQLPFSVPTWQQIKEYYCQRKLQSMRKCYAQISSRTFHGETSKWISLPFVSLYLLGHWSLSNIRASCLAPQGCQKKAVSGSNTTPRSGSLGLRLDSLENVILSSEICTSTFILQMLIGTLETEF